MVEFVGGDAVAHIAALGILQMLPAHLAFQRPHPHGSGLGLSRFFPGPVAEDPQPADAQRLAVGQLASRHPHIPGPDAFGIFIVAVGTFPGYRFPGGPGLAVQAGFHRVVGNLRLQFNMTGLAGIPVAVGGEIHCQSFIGHVHLDGPHVLFFFQVHAEPLSGSIGARAPPVPAGFVHCQGRVAARRRGRGGNRLSVAQQHPFRLPGGGVNGAVRHTVRIISKILVAEEHPIPVKARREQPHPAFEVVVDRDAHGGGVPVVAIPVGDGAAVARAGHEAAGHRREGVGCLQDEGAQRRIRGIDAVGVGVVLGAGAGILQVVGAVVLGHVGTLDVGFAHRKKHGGQIIGAHAGDVLHLRRKFQLAGGGVVVLFQRLIHHTGFPVDHPIVPGALVAQGFFLPEDQFLLFADGHHRFGVHLYAPDGSGVGAAPVEIHPAIVILEQVGVPEGKGSADFFKGLVQRVLGAQNRAVLSLAAGAEIQVLPHLPHIGGIVVD